MVFDIRSTKPDWLWYNLVHIVLSKFVVQKCKRFPAHLYSDSTYLVKLSIHVFASEQQLELWTEKHTNMILSYLLQNEADSD